MMQSSKKYRTHTAHPSPHKKKKQKTNHTANQKKIILKKKKKVNFETPSSKLEGFATFPGAAAGILLPGSLYSKCKGCSTASCSSVRDLFQSLQPLGKRFVPLVVLFTQALFVLGIFLHYVNICEEIIRDLRKGVGERNLWGCGFKAGSSELTTLTKPFLRERIILLKNGFWGEKNKIYLTAVKKNHNFLLSLSLKSSFGFSVQHF